MLELIVILAVVALGSWQLTGAVRAYAIRRAILDIPNDRSSHAAPMPRGGGLAIALTTSVGLLALHAVGRVHDATLIAFLGGGAAIALVGWLDDRRGLSKGGRLAVQTLAASWAIYWLGDFPSLRLGSTVLELGAFGAPIAVLGIVWFINLTNFMDGIDGLAVGQAVVTGSVGGVILVLTGAVELGAVALAIAAASAGFIVWNWAPARIFMGDTGSGFLGFALAAVALGSENVGSVPLIAWAVLHAAFIFDATITLVRRGARGEGWSTPHREHAYQRLLRSGWTHAHISRIYMGITMLLASLALAATLLPSAAVPVLVGSIAGLACLYWKVETMEPLRVATGTEPATRDTVQVSTR